MSIDVVEELRRICLQLPETTERVSHGEPCFFVREKKAFIRVDQHHHGAAHVGFWCPAPAGVQEELVAEDPARFFRPPYVGHHGWLGVRLAADGLPEPDWAEIGEIVRDAYRQMAPASLAAQLDG